MQVGKIQTEAQLNRNSQSLFLLKRSDNSPTCGSVQVNFSPITPTLYINNSLDVEKAVLKSFPIFNADRRFYTPCFILEVDKARYTQNEAIYLSLHEKKIEELCEQKILMFVPRPSINCSFCCICKTIFEDYLTHVTHPAHKAALIKSQFTSQIQNMCVKYGQKLKSSSKSEKQQKIQAKCSKEKPIKKNIQKQAGKIKKESYKKREKVTK